MATIDDRKLVISHDHNKKLATPVVTCRVNFSAQDVALMNALGGVNVFKLKCQLWGADGGLNGGDDFLFTYNQAHFFPDASPSSGESRTFSVTLGEGVLDEDIGVDNVYGRIILQNLLTGSTVQKNTNEFNHSF